MRIENFPRFLDFFFFEFDFWSLSFSFLLVSSTLSFLMASFTAWLKFFALDTDSLRLTDQRPLWKARRRSSSGISDFNFRAFDFSRILKSETDSLEFCSQWRKAFFLFPQEFEFQSRIEELRRLPRQWGTFVDPSIKPLLFQTESVGQKRWGRSYKTKWEGRARFFF